MSLSSYDFLRPFLFQLDPEQAHDLTIKMLSFTQSNFLSCIYKKMRISDPVTLAGITFPNRVGLAAGLDKDGTCLDGFGHLGFGSIEAGTITPKAQPGNPKPRMFRVIDASALINSCGFNNKGVHQFIQNIQQSNYRNTGGILGINIGKNKATPNDKANEDYLYALNQVYQHADYVAINISSPNTQNLRELQNDTALDCLLECLTQERDRLAEQYTSHVPLFLKIAPDLQTEQIKSIAQTLQKHHVDGVIATNTTITRNTVKHLSHSERPGGLSGAPLRHMSNQIIQQLRQELGKDFPIIGVGGVMSSHDAVEKLQAGADIVQIYTGLIYKGPHLVNEVAKALAKATR